MKNIYTNGKRNEKPLTAQQIDEARNAAVKQGFRGNIEYSDTAATSFVGFRVDGEDYALLVLGTDAYPSKTIGTASLKKRAFLLTM